MNESLAGTGFGDYFSRYLIGRLGFQALVVPEAAELAEACDQVLTRTNPGSFHIACIVDRDRSPGRVFSLSPAQVRAIAANCLGYTDSFRRTKLPVGLSIYEIGAGATSRANTDRLAPYRRASKFSKAMVSAYAIDPVSQEVWNNRPWLGRAGGNRWLRKLLLRPQLAGDALVPVQISDRVEGWPALTLALLAGLIAIFGAELAFGIGPATGLLRPTIKTLVAFGGLLRPLVIDKAQWWRLFTAPLLHADATHILFNGIALYLVGRLSERLIGPAWFAAVFTISAIAGSLLSLIVNAPNLVCVGASGGIVGLFAATYTLSFRFPPGDLRNKLQARALGTLLPALIPFVSSVGGSRIDYGAHFGGAIGGIGMGLLLLRLWPRDRALPKHAKPAGMVAALGVVAVLAALLPDWSNYAVFARDQGLYEPWPTSDEEAKRQSAHMVEAKPHDPRARLARAMALIDAHDLPRAEGELRTGLDERALLGDLEPPHYENRMRFVLATVLIEQRKLVEAKNVARRACSSESPGKLRKLLDQLTLCY